MVAVVNSIFVAAYHLLTRRRQYPRLGDELLWRTRPKLREATLQSVSKTDPSYKQTISAGQQKEAPKFIW